MSCVLKILTKAAVSLAMRRHRNALTILNYGDPYQRWGDLNGLGRTEWLIIFKAVPLN